jgi:hypothetical protein
MGLRRRTAVAGTAAVALTGCGSSLASGGCFVLSLEAAIDP